MNHYLKEFIEYLNKNNFSLINENEYKNQQSMLKIKCNKCGSIDEIKRKSFMKRKNKCKNCNIINELNEHKKYALNIAKKNNIEILNINEYKTNKTKLNCLCKKCNNNFLMSLEDIKRYKEPCKICRKQNIFEQSKQLFLSNLEQTKNYTLLNEFTGRKKYVKLRHEICGFEYDVRVDVFNQGRRCPHCQKIKSQQYKIDKAQKEFESLFKTERIDYELIDTYKNSYTKVKIKHKACGNVFEMIPQNFKKGQKCPNCYGNINEKKKNKETLLKIIKDKYELLSEYIGVRHKIKLKHLNCGKEIEVIGEMLFYHNYKCPHCERMAGTSEFEREIQEYVESLISIERNKRFYEDGVYKYELDIYVPSLNFGIECDGIYWHSELAGEKDKNYHINKQKWFKDKGIDIIFIRDNEWNNKKVIVKSFIRNKLGKTKYKIYARKCEIKEIVNNELVTSFYRKSHLQDFNIYASINIGLFYKNKLVSLMSFNKSKENYVLIRFCSMKNFNIVGGFSKLLSYFKKKYNGNIITYADKRISNGNVYLNNGFELKKENRPTYFYTYDYENLFHKSHFRKEKMEKKFIDFDWSLTEWNNMINNGFDRIWDCGTLVYMI